MNSFNEKLKEISIIELIIASALAMMIPILLEIDMQWGFVLFIAYFLLRTRKHLGGLKESAANLFSEISFKTWILLIVSSYVFSLGSGIFLSEVLPSSFSIFGSMSIADQLHVLAVDILLVGILGPIVEETAFRGVILNRFNRYMPIICAILISSLIFMSFHTFEGQLSAFVFAVALSIAYLVSENILVPISLHIGNNLISIAVPYIPNINAVFENQMALYVLYILALISLVYLVRFIYGGYREYAASNVEEFKHKNLAIVISVFIVIIAIAIDFI